MKVYQEQSVATFIKKNENFLLKKESVHSLMLGLCDGILKGKRVAQEALFYSIQSGDIIHGQGIRTNPDKPLALSDMSEKALEQLVKKLKEDNVILEGVVGPIEVSKRFVKLWNVDSRIGMHQGVYQLDKVIHPQDSGGRLRLASFDDFEVVRSFSLGFIEDCFPRNKSKEKAADEGAKNNLKNQALFLWIDSNEIVSMAARSRESKNGATISWVYTPPKFRGKGYAGRAVATLSQQILDDGKMFCNLYTDLLNPTSNSIYQKIGYHKIGESMHFDFK